MMIVLAAVVATAVATACAPAQRPVALLVAGPDSLYAVAAPGAASVRIVRIDPPSIGLVRELLLPPDERVVGVAWDAAGKRVVVTTNTASFAFNARTGSRERIAAVAVAVGRR